MALSHRHLLRRRLTTSVALLQQSGNVAVLEGRPLPPKLLPRHSVPLEQPRRVLGSVLWLVGVSIKAATRPVLHAVERSRSTVAAKPSTKGAIGSHKMLQPRTRPPRATTGPTLAGGASGLRRHGGTTARATVTSGAGKTHSHPRRPNSPPRHYLFCVPIHFSFVRGGSDDCKWAQ